METMVEEEVGELCAPPTPSDNEETLKSGKIVYEDFFKKMNASIYSNNTSPPQFGLMDITWQKRCPRRPHEPTRWEYSTYKEPKKQYEPSPPQFGPMHITWQKRCPRRRHESTDYLLH